MIPNNFENDMVTNVKKNFQLQLMDQLEGQLERLRGQLEREEEHRDYLKKEYDAYVLRVNTTNAQINAAVTKLLKIQEGMH